MKDKLIPVKDKGGLARDPRSGAIVSTDTTSYELARRKKQLREKQHQRISQLEQRLDNINTKMESMEEMLARILDKLE